MIRLFSVLSIVLSLSTLLGQTLPALNSTEGVLLSWGGTGGKARLDIVEDEELTTDGNGALWMQAHAPKGKGSHYFGMIIPFPEPLDLTDASLIFDARSDKPTPRALYVRAYNRGEKQPAWSFNSWNGLLSPTWRTFRLQTGLCPEGLAWEKALVGDRQATHVDRLEIIVGTRDEDVDVSVMVDNLRLGPRIGTLAELTKVKTFSRETVLVRDGKPLAVILHPDSEAGARAAALLVAAVRERTGVELPARPGTLADTEPDHAAIFLGTLFTNPALQVLYARGLTPVDAICPGEGGALVHTVYDPFGKGVNALVVGGMDATGLERAAKMLAGIIGMCPKGTDLAVPGLFEAAYGKSFLTYYPWADDPPAKDRLKKGLQEGQSALDRGRHCSVAAVLASVAQHYRYTHHSVEAKLFVQLWDLYGKSAVADPRKYGGPWGFDSDFMSKDVVPGWDLIEEDPGLTDEERLRTTRTMGRWLAEAVVPKCAGAARSTHVLFNHQTFPGLGTMFAGLYLTEHYKLIEGEVWLGIADAMFKRQAGYFKVFEDCNGYQWLTNGHVFRYAMARPDRTVFENGNAARIVDFCIGCMDNLGYQVPYGDTGSWVCWNTEMICLDIAAFATGNPNALWAAAYKRRIKKTRPAAGEFRNPGDAPVPSRYNGVHVWPLEPQYYRTFQQDSSPPVEMCFDKISFRQAMDPEAFYALLDGLSNGGHKHYDGNSIPRITQFGRIWLADNDYYKAPLKYHNSVLVIRDGESQVIPPFVELIGAGESERFGYSRTRVENYAGADWERTLVWLKESGDLLVLDRLTALEDGDFQFRLLWHGVGEATLTEDGMHLTQKGPDLWVQVARGPRNVLDNDTDLGANWNGYPYAPPVVRSLSSIATVSLKRNESYLFATAFHGSSDGTEKPWKMGFIQGLPGVMVTTPSGNIGVGLGALAMDTIEGRFSTDADVLVADADGLSLLGATNSDLEGEVIQQSDQPECIDMPDVETGSTLANVPLAPVAAAAGVVFEVPEQPLAWEIFPSPTRVVISGNAGMPGSIADACTLGCDPSPAAHNIFSSGAPNSPVALTDGSWKSTSDSVMFDPDREVAITFTFKAETELRDISWHQWWAATSSRQTAYLLRRAKVEVSSDGFRDDIRRAAVLDQPGKHPDWGSPVFFHLSLNGIKANAVRLVLTPVTGSAIYLGEIIVTGNADGKKGLFAPYTFTAAAVAAGPPQAPVSLLLGTAQGELFAYAPDGTRQWSQSFPGRINDLCAVDVDGDGIDEVAVARQDDTAALLTHAGKTMWERKLEYYRQAPHANLVRAGDLDGDGTPEIIVGGNNWRFYAFSATGKMLWNYEAVHSSRSGVVADLDGDGKAEVACGTHYYSMTVLKPDGTRKWRAGFGPICWDIAAGRFDGDGTRGLICGSGDGGIYLFDSKGKRRLALRTGDEVRDVCVADLDGDGRDEALAAGFSHSVYCFDGSGKPLWRTDLGDPVRLLRPVIYRERPFVVAVTCPGDVVTLDAGGQAVARRTLGSAPTVMTVLAGDVVVATEDGRVRRLRPVP